MLPHAVLRTIPALCCWLIWTAAFAQGNNDSFQASGFVEVTGGRLYFEVAGDGDALVFLHDGLLHASIWDDQFDVFAEHYRVVRYDRREYGRSSVPESPYSDVDDLLAVLDELGIERAGLIGLSAGGRLAVDFTLAHPQRVTRLVLVGAVVSGFELTDHFVDRGGRLDPSLVVSDPGAYRRYWLTEDPYEVAPDNVEVRQRVLEMLEAFPHNAEIGKFRLARPPARPAIGALDEIAIPALIVVGEHDIADAHAHAGALDAGLPRSNRVVIRGAGHRVPIERPQEFNRTVLGFLRGEDVFELIATGDVSAAVARYDEVTKDHPDLVLFGERRMNTLGYQLLRAGEIDGAVELFRLNVRAWPESANVLDSLGEGLLRLGQREAAIASYRKSLELDPNNTNATRILRLLDLEEKPMPELSGPYLGQTPPGGEPQVFAPEIVSTELREHSSTTFSDDGKTLLFTRQTPWGGHSILETREQEGGWSRPRQVSFSSAQLDDGAAYHPSGDRLFFGSRRPTTPEGEANPVTDIWYVEIDGDRWGEPRRLGPPVNSESNEGFPSFTRAGTMYFHSSRPGGEGGMDIYRARLVDGAYEVENLGRPVNSDAGDGGSFIAPDESYLLFGRFGAHAADLLVSFKTADGLWSEPVSLGEALGLQLSDITIARVSPDGKYLFILDAGDIHWVDAGVVERVRK
ncbi:MAG: alpha/beta fold hydrolase [bacterium]|nr:alpha/beta fold hydrolase [bacterium]